MKGEEKRGEEGEEIGRGKKEGEGGNKGGDDEGRGKEKRKLGKWVKGFLVKGGGEGGGLEW